MSQQIPHVMISGVPHETPPPIAELVDLWKKTDKFQAQHTPVDGVFSDAWAISYIKEHRLALLPCTSGGWFVLEGEVEADGYGNGDDRKRVHGISTIDAFPGNSISEALLLHLIYWTPLELCIENGEVYYMDDGGITKERPV